MLGVRVIEWGFRNKQLEGYYARDFDPSVLAVQEDLRPEVATLFSWLGLGSSSSVNSSSRCSST